jgi:hypothetical protein
VCQNSRSDDHTLFHSTVYVLSRVVSRLNSEFCIPLFFLGFDAGLNVKNTLERKGTT